MKMTLLEIAEHAWNMARAAYWDSIESYIDYKFLEEDSKWFKAFDDYLDDGSEAEILNTEVDV
jgi:hypothetical protein